MANTQDIGTVAVIVLLALAVGLFAYAAALKAARLRRKRDTGKGRPGQAILDAIVKVAPQSSEGREESEQALARAGVKLSAQTLWGARLACGGMGLACGLLIGAMAGGGGAHMADRIGGCAIGALPPPVSLLLERRQWQQQIERELPNALDLLCLTVMAGSTFDAGVRIVSQRTTGVLADALKDVVSMARFTSTTDALGRLADNAGVKTLTVFVASLKQARQSGMSIADILRSQAESIRTTRRLAVEEQINKLPMKMTFPIMLIFLAFLLLIMAPLVASMISTLSQVAG